jgi:hypothetical protein
MEHPAIRRLGLASASNIVNLRDIEIPGAYQFADIAVVKPLSLKRT